MGKKEIYRHDAQFISTSFFYPVNFVMQVGDNKGRIEGGGHFELSKSEGVT